ncbi:hypothetical protein EVA_07961 [gut metagenome]|uniref:Uncharacterized protein n=1 Tax=gut metagenome TaxID=749906 RepID=J9GNM2_9ZZZZ
MTFLFLSRANVVILPHSPYSNALFFKETCCRAKFCRGDCNKPAAS